MYPDIFISFGNFLKSAKGIILSNKSYVVNLQLKMTCLLLLSSFFVVKIEAQTQCEETASSLMLAYCRFLIFNISN